ncbi:Hypothetical predicted protein [Olea europaea subsp. europaea]|uniref:Uncharacterized protein n=1 Tax=Olea europaea subsp. europaea TaxID=158383 RepID=A0A8S0RRW3_OLEEU|nr:Hypothetical predicted protein [Olea europaea subsp. europaea]
MNNRQRAEESKRFGVSDQEAKDNALDLDMHCKSTSGTLMSFVEEKNGESNNFQASTSKIKVEENHGISEDETNDSSVDKQVPMISRKDSIGELLLNLPRIASLP